MAVIKVACSKCGQKVSGDESFFGTSVDCPICTSKIYFPANPNAPQPSYGEPPLPQVDDPQPLPTPQQDLPPGALDSMPPTALPRGNADDPLADVPRRVSEPRDRSDEPAIDLPKAGGESEENDDRSESGSEEDTDRVDIPRKKSNDDDEEHSPALGATSLVFGILGCLSCSGVILSPAAIICGHIALGRAKQSASDDPPGKKLALWGTILGYAGMAIGLLALIAGAVYVALNPEAA